MSAVGILRQHDAIRTERRIPFLIQSSTRGSGSDFRIQARISFLLSQYSKKAPSAAFATMTVWYRIDELNRRSITKRALTIKRLTIGKIDVNKTRSLAQFLRCQ